MTYMYVQLVTSVFMHDIIDVVNTFVCVLILL